MVDKSGILIASGGLFEGTITASAGSIGGFNRIIIYSFKEWNNYFISGSPSNSDDDFLSVPNFNVKVVVM